MSQSSAHISPTSRLTMNTEEARRNIDKFQQIFDEARTSRLAELKKHQAQVDRRNILFASVVMVAILWIGLRVLSLYIHGGPLVTDLQVLFVAVMWVFMLYMERCIQVRISVFEGLVCTIVIWVCLRYIFLALPIALKYVPETNVTEYQLLGVAIGIFMTGYIGHALTCLAKKIA
jgi:hypothetical protein